MTMEFGRETEDDVCEPSRSSGSHKSCCIRLTPSCETRGREGNLSDCFQFKIFCRVTCLCSLDSAPKSCSLEGRIYRIANKRRESEEEGGGI